MKQGRPVRDTTSGNKTSFAGGTAPGYTTSQPISRGVSPSAVSQIGLQYVNSQPMPLYEGRGLKAPMVSQTTSNKGSQGKY